MPDLRPSGAICSGWLFFGSRPKTAYVRTCLCFLSPGLRIRPGIANFAYAWPFLLIMFIVYEIWKYFKLKKIRKQYEDAQSQYSSQYQSQSSSRNDNPDIIDVEYKVVDEEKTGDDN